MVHARCVMNTIPTIFNEALPSYTVVGGRERLASTGISAVILNRSGRYPRRVFFQELEKAGFDYVVSVENSPERYDLEELTGRFPFARFVLPQRRLNLGEQINLAATEVDSPLFFVLWNDLKILTCGGARRMAERLGAGFDDDRNYGDEKNSLKKNGGENGGENGSEEKSPLKRLCTIPVIQNSRFETLPTLVAPAFLKGKVRTLLFSPHNEEFDSLYPFDGIGIYDRERFIRMMGFDTTLNSAHWQLMDFGFRAHLWGEEIRVSQQLRLSYDGESPSEDNTAEASYRRFYFKNLAPVFSGDHARLPFRKFLGFSLSSRSDPMAAWDDFSEAKRWVKKYSFRWRSDARTLTERWPGIPREATLFRA